MKDWQAPGRAPVFCFGVFVFCFFLGFLGDFFGLESREF